MKPGREVCGMLGYKLYEPMEADTVAYELTRQDNMCWTYKAKHDPQETGFSFIEVFDDEGCYVGRL